MHGKGNRILYSPTFSQGFEVVADKRTRQGAGVSNGGTTIRVTGRPPLATAYRGGRTRAEIKHGAAPLMRWRDRNRDLPAVGTQGPIEAPSANNDP
jgi:hypothetical protein